MQETLVRSLGWEDPLEKGKYSPVFWPGEFHGLYSPWGCKELDMTERLSLSLMHGVPLYSPPILQLMSISLPPVPGYYKRCCSEYSCTCLLMHTCTCFVGCMLRSGLPGGKESACQCRSRRSSPWACKIPQRRKWQPIPIFLSRNPMDKRSLVGYSPWGHKESDTT